MDQVTLTDLEQMYAAKKYDQIEQARLDGRLNTIMGVPQPEREALEHAQSGGNLSAAQVHELYSARRYDVIEQAAREGRIIYPA
jgi:hypothetical protein